MRVLGFKRFHLAPILALLAFLPPGVEGQLRSVISNEISVTEDEAMLRLGFLDQEDLTISLLDGQVVLDGETVGSYEKTDGLFSAWRALLGQVITLDDGSLANALNDWDPPRSLSGGAEELASRLDRALEDALAQPEVLEDAQDQEDVTFTLDSEVGVIGALLSRTGALSGLAEALEGVSLDEIILKIGEDVVVGSGEVLEGTLIVVDGDLDVLGRIDGDVILTEGVVRLRDEGLITGDLRITDGSLDQGGGSVSGSLIRFDGSDEVRIEARAREDLKKELESEIRRDIRESRDSDRLHSANPFFSVLGNVGTAIAGLLENLVTFLILAILGVLAVHFQGERLEVVATTARRAPVRAAVVGLAGGFFILPIWIVGIIALAISIIGIPVLLAWVPLFPIAAGLAFLLGFLAVARNVGEWVADQEYRGLEWIRGSNTFYTIIAGVGAFMVPCVAASASQILGFGFLTGLLGFVGSLVTFAASAVGLGAVLLTRGGKIRPLESYYDFDEEYWADAEPVASEPVTQSPSGEPEGVGEEETPPPEAEAVSDEETDDNA